MQGFQPLIGFFGDDRILPKAFEICFHTTIDREDENQIIIMSVNITWIEPIKTHVHSFGVWPDFPIEILSFTITIMTLAFVYGS